jgi:gamma-glutamylcyclotransferase (GGCT)/AIG2-like uncharacterized protein YtfP
MPLYFAYGANMDVPAMAGRCPSARVIGPARLPRHRFFITSDGYASVARDPRAAVHGLLWEVALSDVRALDRFEEIDRGLYVKITQPVIADAGPRRALIYVATATQAGAPRPGYLDSVLASAEAAGLPAAYRAEMARFAARSPSAQRAAPSPSPSRSPSPATGRSGQPRASDTWRWEP